jgi:cation-transporting ATPase I
MGVSDRARRLRWPLARRRRRIWSAPGRAHIEIRVPPDHEAMAHAVASALSRIEGVHWAALIPDLAHVVVSFEEGEVDLGALVDVVEDLEHAHGVSGDGFGEDRPHHPGDTAPMVREAVALAADGAAVGLALAGRLTRMARLPVEVAALIPLVQSQPRVRRLLEAVTGPTVADVGLAVANAALQGFAQGPVGLVVDGVVRGSRLGELAAGRDVWRAREPELITPTRIGVRALPSPPPAADRAW